MVAGTGVTLRRGSQAVRIIRAWHAYEHLLDKQVYTRMYSMAGGRSCLRCGFNLSNFLREKSDECDDHRGRKAQTAGSRAPTSGPETGTPSPQIMMLRAWKAACAARGRGGMWPKMRRGFSDGDGVQIACIYPPCVRAL